MPAGRLPLPLPRALPGSHNRLPRFHRRHPSIASVAGAAQGQRHPSAFRHAAEAAPQSPRQVSSPAPLAGSDLALPTKQPVPSGSNPLRMAFSSPRTSRRVDSTSLRFLMSCTTSFLALPIPMSIGLAEQRVPAPPVWRCSSSLPRRRRCNECSWLRSEKVRSRLPGAPSRR